MSLRQLISRGLFLSGCALVGCVSLSVDSDSDPDADLGSPLPPAELEMLYQRAHDPRQHFIMIQAGESGPVFDGAHRLHPEQRWTEPFRSDKDWTAPILTIQGDSIKNVTALVDTTSAENWTDLETANRMNLIPLGPPAFATQPVHVDDSAQGFLCVSDRLRIGEIQVETGLFFVRNWRAPLQILDRGFDDPHPQCVLGMRFLLPFAHVRFDFPGRSLTLAVDGSYNPSPPRIVASIPYRERAWALTVEGNLNGEPVPVVLDTAGQYGLAVANPTPAPVTLTMGDWALEPTVAVDVKEAGLTLDRAVHVGLGVLSRYIVTLDHLQGLVHIEQDKP